MTVSTERVWSSPVTFLFAAIAAAVGLGNIWRFPYLLGTNGGSLFLLLYLFFIVFICVTMIIVELFIGRLGGGSPIASLRKLTREYRLSRAWVLIGWVCMVTVALVYSFYSVVSGWSLDYLWASLSGKLSTQAGATGAAFGAIQGAPGRMIFWHTVVILVTGLTVAFGVRAGLERSLKVMMPGLFLLLCVLVVYAATAGDMRAALAFLLLPDVAEISAEVVLIALGQALFSVAVGGGALLTFGSYLPRAVSITKMAVIIALADTAVALLAGFAIFPWVFKFGLDPGEGPGLIFITLPLAFGQMSWGAAVAVMFFALLALAALSTTLTLLEPLVAWIEEYQVLRRPRIVLLVSLPIWLAGIAHALSFNVWKDFKPLFFVDFLSDKNIFGLVEMLVSSVFMPLNILAMALFVGWRLVPKAGIAQVGFDNGLYERVWLTLVRFVLPVAIGAIFVFAFA